MVQRNGSDKLTPTELSLRSIPIITSVFICHRLLSFRGLLGDAHTTGYEIYRFFLCGFLSDLWIAVIFATLIWPLAFAGRWFFTVKTTVRFVAALLFTVGLATAAHQAYVDFFHQQITLYHLNYLFDPEFVTENSASVMQLSSIGVILSGILAAFPASRIKITTKHGAALVMAAMVLCGLAVHNRNIHYRVQWFVPKNLAVNYVEHLYLVTTKSLRPTPLTPAEVQFIADSYKIKTNRRPHNNDAQDLILQTLRRRFVNSTQAAQGPLILTVMLESLRPVDTGFFARNSTEPKASLTPQLDRLYETGLGFTQAYATGTVTRSGQEASWCGYFSGERTSLMRDHPHITPLCLPKAAQQDSPYKVKSFWTHGGDGRFDRQADFWRRQGVDRIVAEQDFPASTPRGAWGVSDIAAAQRTADVIDKLRRQNPRAVLMGMWLTATNHIPWTLPSDAAPNAPQSAAQHPSYMTTFYTDSSLRRLIDKLRQSGHWQRTLLIVASDHGQVGVRPYQQTSETSQNQLRTHINLVVHGGLMENTLAELGFAHKIHSQPISQLFVARLIRALVFSQKAKDLWPRQTVRSELAQGLYFPRYATVIPHRLYQTSPLGLPFTPRILETLIRYRHQINSIEAGKWPPSMPL